MKSHKLYSYSTGKRQRKAVELHCRSIVEMLMDCMWAICYLWRCGHLTEFYSD